MKRLYYIVIISLVSISGFFPSTVHALGEQIKITEIMYDLEGSDTDREWIEIKNVGPSEVILSGWKVYDGSNHILNEPPTNGGQGSLTLATGGFAVIAQNALVFLSDHPSFSGTVIDSVLSLTNTADTVRILDASNQIMDEVAYTSELGANGDGNSLTWYLSGWIVATPTPGVENTGNPPPPLDGGGTSSGGSSVVNSVPKPVMFADSQKIPVWTALVTPSMPSLFTHVPFTLTTKVFSPKKQEYAVGRFVYNLGDGRVIERKNNDAFGVEYQESGNYILYFEYYESPNNHEPTITEQILLSVEDTPIILSVSEKPVYKITLSNAHTTTINISGWRLSDTKSQFVFPKNTLLPGKRQVTLNSAIHGLSGTQLSLTTPTSFVVAEYPSSIVPDVGIKKDMLPENIISPLTQQAVFSENISFSKEIKNPQTNKTYTPNEIEDTSLSSTDSSQLTANTHGVFFNLINRWTLFFILFALLSGVLLYLFLQTEVESIKEVQKPEINGEDESNEYTIIEHPEDQVQNE